MVNPVRELGSLMIYWIVALHRKRKHAYHIIGVAAFSNGVKRLDPGTPPIIKRPTPPRGRNWMSYTYRKEGQTGGTGALI